MADWEQMDERTFTCEFDEEGELFGSVQHLPSDTWYFALTDLRWRTHRDGDLPTRAEAMAMVEQMAREAR